MRCLAGITPACPNNHNLGREYTMDEYKIGPWQKHESILPEGMMRVPMPSLDRPWWKNELGYIEKSWRLLQGRTPR
jgi:hypothetical protein